MTLAVPQIELTSGTIVCLHLPQETCYPADDILTQLLQFAARESKRAIIAQPAVVRHGIREFFHHQSSLEWLISTGKLSLEDATQVIHLLGNRIAQTLSDNSMTPRCLLGLAAAIANKPDVLLYSTSGLDPTGKEQLHQFVASQAQHICAIHVSYPSIYGDGAPHPRICPEAAQCVTFKPGRSAG